MDKMMVTRALCAGVCGLSVTLAACSGSSGNTGSDDHGGTASSVSGDAPASPAGAAAPSTNADQPQLPSSCDPVKAVITRDLHFAPATVKTNTAIALSCELDERADNSGGNVHVIYMVPDIESAADSFADAKKAQVAKGAGYEPVDLTGVGEQAFATQDEGAIDGVEVLSGNTIVKVLTYEYDLTGISQTTWTTVAKDLTNLIS